MEELCKQENKSEDYVFAQIISDGPVLNAMSRLREVYPHTLGLSFCQSVQQNTPELSLDLAALEPMELFSRFYQQITGQQLDSWYRSNRFCGQCGKLMVPDHKERMVHCEHCGNTVYPKICPGVIVAVTDGDRLLLTKYANRPGSVNYALVAGFTEIGETLEETSRFPVWRCAPQVWISPVT